MTDFTITPEDAIAVLNRIHAADPTVLPRLIRYRVPCNETVAGDPTVHVGLDQTDKTMMTVGLLGILNGIFGADEATGYGPILAYYDGVGDLDRFELTDFAAIAEKRSNE